MTPAVIISLCGLGFAILMQAVAFVWFLATLSSRVATVEQLVKTGISLNAEMVRIQTVVNGLVEALKEVKALIGTVFEKLEGKADKP